MFKNRSAERYTDNYYQAAAKRTPVVAALGPLLLRSTARSALHGLHPSNMSQIAPFDLAGADDPYCWPTGSHGTRALHTGDTTSRVITEARGAGLHGTPPLHAMHRVRDTQASHQNALPRLGRSKWSAA